jgi:hypothetical protein
MTSPGDEFISEPITPTPGRFDASAMSRDEPGIPSEFIWRGKPCVVAQVLSTWKTTGNDRGETYLRRHWFRILTTDGRQMTLYCERQARSKNPKSRWWIYSLQG